jgi:hypothetical protein
MGLGGIPSKWSGKVLAAIIQSIFNLIGVRVQTSEKERYERKLIGSAPRALTQTTLGISGIAH